MPDIAPQVPTHIDPDIAAALAAVRIISPSSFVIDGERRTNLVEEPVIPSPAAQIGAGSSELSIEQTLAHAIQASLYEQYYTRRRGEERATQSPSAGEDTEFAHRLEEANAGRERWDPGWVIQQFGANGQVFVCKGERQRSAIPGSFISDGVPGMPPQLGGSVRLRAPSGTHLAQPGYYFAFGETLGDLAEKSDLVRLYFHCGAANAAPLVAALTSVLNRFQVPFQLKVPAHDALYDRADTVVLYVDLRFFAISARLVDGVRQQITLAPSVPLFTKRLWPGIGAAVDPGNGESFGSHRCRLTAEGIVDAWQSGKQDVPGRWVAVATRFAAAGLDLQRPYLGANWIDLLFDPTPPCLA